MQTQNAFKPALKVLSRRPAPKMIAKKDLATGLSQLTLEDDSDDEEKKKALTPEEVRAKQQRELEEKQRRYEEARAKIFGTAGGSSSIGAGGGASGPSSGTSTPGTTTPPRSHEGTRGGRGGRGRVRGGPRNQISDARGGGGNRQRDHERDQQPRFTQPPSNATQELYDPGYMPRPSPRAERGGATPASGRSTPREPRDEAPVRSPRGPDGTGRGGFGFTRRNADNN